MRVILTVPELPEVETLRRGLAARIIGMRVTAVEIGDRKIFGGPEDAIRHDIEGHQISRVERQRRRHRHRDPGGARRPGRLGAGHPA